MELDNRELYEKYIYGISKENITPKGKAVLQFCDIRTDAAKRLQAKVVEASKNGTWDEYQKLKNELHERFGTRKVVIDNIVTKAGRTILARILKGDRTYSGEINYCTLGTGDTASTTSDTTLETEQYRKQISSGSYSTYHTYISTFFTAAEFIGTIKEIGHVIDGAAGADTGQQWSRIADPETAELPITKSGTESLTCDYAISL